MYRVISSVNIFGNSLFQYLYKLYLYWGELFVTLTHICYLISLPEVVHDGVCCNVCTLSPITGTRWKCSECPDYDMCHSCYKIYRHVHSKTHSFTKIGTPGSLS